MHRTNLGPRASQDTTDANRHVVQIVLGLLALAVAGFAGFVMSVFLLMASDSCMADATPRICSTIVQQWIVWLPLIGAGLGMAAGGVAGAIVLRSDREGRRSVTVALGLGWGVFVVAELGVLILLQP